MRKIAKFLNRLISIRNESTQITNNLTLSESLRISNEQFKLLLTNASIYPLIFNDEILNKILNSNPNYNYLYSNYSSDYTEPLNVQFLETKSFINLLYGPDLDLIELNRQTNRVDDPGWLRSQTCNNQVNYLLKGQNAQLLKNLTCELTDFDLANFYTTISKYIDIGKVKQIVYLNTNLSNPNLLLELQEVYLAYTDLIESYAKSNLSSSISSAQDLWSNFAQADLKTYV